MLNHKSKKEITKGEALKLIPPDCCLQLPGPAPGQHRLSVYELTPLFFFFLGKPSKMKDCNVGGVQNHVVVSICASFNVLKQ